MEAEFKSTQRFVTPRVDIFLKWLKLAICLKSAVFDYFNPHF